MFSVFGSPLLKTYQHITWLRYCVKMLPPSLGLTPGRRPTRLRNGWKRVATIRWTQTTSLPCTGGKIRYNPVLQFLFSRKKIILVLICFKYRRIRVPTLHLPSRRILKLCVLSRVGLVKMMDRGRLIQPRVEYQIEYRVEYQILGKFLSKSKVFTQIRLKKIKNGSYSNIFLTMTHKWSKTRIPRSN